MATTLTVHLSERSYPIHFGADLSAEVRAFVGELTSAGRKFAVITDANLRARQGEALRASRSREPARMMNIASLSEWPDGENAA